MKRRPDDHAERGGSAHSAPGAFLSRWLHRPPRLSLYLGVGLGVPVLLALLVALFSGTSH